MTILPEQVYLNSTPVTYQTSLGSRNPEPSRALDPTLPNYTALFQETLVEPASSGFIKRGLQACKILYHEKGLLYTSAKLGLSAIAATIVFGSVFWDLQEAVYAMERMWKRGELSGKELGDIGGWASLAFMDLVGLLFFFKNEIAEAEYKGIKKTCKIFINHLDIPREDLYDMILTRLASLNSETLFSRTMASRILIALELVGKPDEEAQYDKGSNWAKHAAMIDAFYKIESDFQQGNILKHYCQYIYQGQKSVKKTMGLSAVLSHVALGVAGPLILLGDAVNDLLGMIKLGEEMLGIKPPEIGCVGEWISVSEWRSNILQNLCVAGLLHYRYLIAPGKVAVMKKIYKRKLRQLGNPDLHSKLREIANQELSEMGFKGIAFPRSYPIQAENRENVSMSENSQADPSPEFSVITL